jgi:hypothetical protein
MKRFLNFALLFAILFLVFSMAWEVRTRQYLQGFADAIVPLAAPPEEKTEAILAWMKSGPSRLPASSLAILSRDPSTALNHRDFLSTCGTATNAFLNLARAANLPARRLLLMDRGYWTKHVVAEVRIQGRWIVVDPMFRMMFRGTDGHLLTREELADPAVFSEAKPRGYDSIYDFQTTDHIRIAKIPVVGSWLQKKLMHQFPNWSNSLAGTMVFDRESSSAILLSLFLILVILVMRGFCADKINKSERNNPRIVASETARFEAFAGR